VVLKVRHSAKEIRKNFEMWCSGRMEIPWTDGVKSAEILHRVKEIRNILPTGKRRKANWTGHILYKNYFLKHVVRGKIEGTRRGGRRLKKLLLKGSKDTVSRKRKHQLELSGEPALQAVTNGSEGMVHVQHRTKS
jgi:hypothetical protein